MTAPDLSVVVVNYNSASYLAGFLDSLHRDAFTIGGRPGTIEVIVVENASRNEDHRLLESLCRPPVKLVRNTENVGYALANNQGLHVASGRWHLVSNPDVLVRPGCLQALLDTLEATPGAAITGPLSTIDVEGRVFLPPNELPDPYLEALTCLGRRHDAVARYNARRRSRYAWRYWRAEAPVRLPMLSGGFFLGRRETFLAHGLFDPGFPLYYEDTDLFRRYHERGLGLWHVPAARIVHHYSRSAMPRIKASLYRNQIGARRYFQKHFGGAGARTWAAFLERAETGGRDGECPFPVEDLPPAADPPILDVPSGDRVYLEIAGNARFSLSAAMFPEGPGPFRLPAPFWEDLAPVRYWCRALEPATGRHLKAWRITKCPKPA